MDYYVYVLRRGGRVAARDARAEPAMRPPLHGRRAQTLEQFSGERRPE
jgi:hypothetical protein